LDAAVAEVKERARGVGEWSGFQQCVGFAIVEEVGSGQVGGVEALKG
jgi:hypothetical protein